MNVEKEDNDFFKYGLTPPSNPRATKRDKEKSRSRKLRVSKQHLGDMASGQHGWDDKRKLGHRQYSPGPKASSGDDENEPKGERKRKGNSKNFKKSIAQDRDYKLQTNATDMGIPSGSTPQQAMTVDSPDRFRSLESIPVPAATQLSSLPGSPRTARPVKSVSRQSSKQPETDTVTPCPKDRADFHKVFTLLIRLGNRASKEREMKGVLYHRQLSSEQEYFQNRAMDVIWLELRAYMAGRSIHQQDAYLLKAREAVGDVLNEVFNFKLEPKGDPSEACSSIPFLRPPVSGAANCNPVIVEEPDASLDYMPIDMTRPDEDLSDEPQEAISTTQPLTYLTAEDPHPRPTTPSLGKSLPEAIAEQKEALMQVAALMQKLEAVESLYKTTKAIGQEHALYAMESFTRRIDTLCLWMNLTRDIGHKLQQMAHILHVENVMGVDWPWLDYESPNVLLNRIRNPADTITPNINLISPSDEETSSSEYSASGEEEEGDSDEDEEEEDSEEESDEKSAQNNKSKKESKNVHFSVTSSGATSPEATVEHIEPAALFSSPSSTSTPLKPTDPSIHRSTSMTSTGTVSRSSSCLSFEESTRTAVYRKYVERELKKMGMTKLLARLKYLLEGTLQRARDALEKHQDAPSYANVASLEVS